MATIEELAAKVAGLEQQMAAITVPPTEYYTSIFSGEDIDAAIKKVNDGIVGGVSSFNGRTGAVKPQAGDYNATQIPVSGEPKAETVAAALSNKAPAGFGLGAPVKLMGSANDCKLSGWYLSGKNVPNAPDGDGGYWLIRVDGRDDTVLYQTAYANRQNSGVPNFVICRRYYVSSEWSPWEYIVAPKELGVEYRTIERYQQVPIYTKAVNFGAAPNATSKTVEHGITGFNQCVDVSGTLGGANLIGHKNIVGILVNASQITIEADDDLSKSNVYVILKYTKATS